MEQFFTGGDAGVFSQKAPNFNLISISFTAKGSLILKENSYTSIIK